MTEGQDPDPRAGAGDAFAVDNALATLEAARDLALLIVDTELRMTLAIGGLLAERGWQSRDLVGRLSDDVLPVEDAAQILPRYRAALAGTPQSFDHVFASGQRCVIDVRPSGHAPHRHATILWRDVTAQHDAEAAGRLADERYRLLADNASDIVALQTPDARILWISPSVRTVLGHEPENLVGSSAYDLGHPDDVAVLREQDARVDAGDDATRSLARLRHADESYRWIETTSHAIRDPLTGEVSGVVRSGRDVTDRVLAEQALRDSEAHAGTLLATMAEAAVLYDADGNVAARSLLSRQLLGHDDGVLRLDTSESVAGWVDAGGAALAPDRHPALLARGMSAPVTSVLGLPGPDGARRWVRATASAVRGASRAGAVVLTLVDVTDLRHARVNLERSNEELRRTALVASHDIAAPLAMLRRELAEIPTDTLPDEQTARLQRAGDAADVIQEILSAVLSCAQVDHAAMTAGIVDLAAVVAETLAILGEPLRATGATVHVGELPDVNGDHVLLRQLLQNLIDNAIAHHPGPAARIDVRSERRGETMVLIVEDDGDGIRPGERDSVFGLFARGESANAGHGIGLSTAKRIVELHGGRIWVEDVAPHGARFCATLAEAAGPHEPRATT